MMIKMIDGGEASHIHENPGAHVNQPTAINIRGFCKDGGILQGFLGIGLGIYESQHHV